MQRMRPSRLGQAQSRPPGRLARSAECSSLGRIARMSDSFSKQGNEPPAFARPRAVSVIAVIGFIVSLLWFPFPSAWHRGFWYAFHMLLSSTLGIVGMYGLWRMWRWSLFVYAGSVVLDTLHYCVL